MGKSQKSIRKPKKKLISKTPYIGDLKTALKLYMHSFTHTYWTI